MDSRYDAVNAELYINFVKLQTRNKVLVTFAYYNTAAIPEYKNATNDRRTSYLINFMCSNRFSVENRTTTI